MFTELFAATPPHETAHEPHVHNWHNARVLVREATCAIRGHDYLQHAEGNRLFLRCADCGHETHGWYIDIPS